MTYTRLEFLQLTSGQSGMVAYGEVEWAGLNMSWRATLPVAVTGFASTEVQFQMKIPQGRPSEPTAILIVRGMHMKRIDVNGEHQGKRASHIQWSATPDVPEQYSDAPDWFFPLPLGDTVSEGAYRRVFEDAAKVLGIDIQGTVWNEPPEIGVRA